MSRIAIFSDIHSNLPALEKVVEDATAQNVNSFACLGDIVGYGPNPSECVSYMQELKCVCIKGNHDEYIQDSFDLAHFNDQAREALEWTRNSLSAGQKSWLASLPYTKRIGRNMLVHASIDSPEQWNYVRNSFDASMMMQKQNTPLCFYGHTHIPVIYEMQGTSAKKIKPDQLTIKKGSKYLINTGSVGQPRDGDTRASYVIFDKIQNSIEFRRVKYDMQKVVNEITATSLPDTLAERLQEAS